MKVQSSTLDDLHESLISRTVLPLIILILLLSIPFFSVSASTDLMTYQDEWRNNTAHVDEIVFKVIPDPNDQLQALAGGDVDAIGNFVDDQLISENLLTDSNIEMNETLKHSFVQLSFNCAKWPTNYRGIRRALAFAVDKWAMSESAWEGTSRPVDGPVLPSLGLWSIEHPSSGQNFLGTSNYYNPDPLRGNLSLLQDGFYDIDNDGWREWFNATKAEMTWKEVVNIGAFNPDVSEPNISVANEAGPNPDAFTVHDATIFNDLNNWEEVELEILSEETDFASHAPIWLQEAYHSVGINTKLLFLSQNQMFSRIIDGNFSAAFNWLPTNTLDSNFLPLILTEFKTDSSTNEFSWRWSNATYDAKVKEMVTTPFFEEVLKAAYDAQKILWHEQPMVILHANFFKSLYRTDVLKGWIQPSGDEVAGYWSALKVHRIDDQGNPIVGGQLRMAVDGFRYPMNPLRSHYENDWKVLTLIHDSPWKQDPYTFQIIPWLADDWKIEIVYNDTLAPYTGDLNSVNLTETPLVQKVTFQLNPNFKWHDGQPVLPEDVAFTYWLHGELREYYSSWPAASSSNSNEVIDHERITYDNDSGTVTLVIKSLSYFSFLETGKLILPKHIWKPVLEQQGFLGLLSRDDPPIGSGPFKWKSRVPGSVIVLERNLEWPFRPDKPVATMVPKTSTESNHISMSTRILSNHESNGADLLSFRIDHASFLITLVSLTLSSLALLENRKWKS